MCAQAQSHHARTRVVKAHGCIVDPAQFLVQNSRMIDYRQGKPAKRRGDGEVTGSEPARSLRRVVEDIAD